MSWTGQGRCGLCGHVGTFIATDRPTRESYDCESCHASLRYRVQAAAITATFHRPDAPLVDLVADGTLQELTIYEPGIIGPFRRVFRTLPHYFNSYFWPDIEPGRAKDGVRCEDLHRLTLSDESVDLVVSSDIFEHVREPMTGFAEAMRVLRPGGSHVFTVPVSWPFSANSTSRVETSGSEDVFVLPPQYHGSPTDPKGSLVYTDFGLDLPDRLNELGYQTTTYHGHRNAVAFVARKPAPVTADHRSDS